MRRIRSLVPPIFPVVAACLLLFVLLTEPRPAVAADPVGIKVVKTLVPFSDLSDALQEKGGRYLMVPFDEIERLRRAKEAVQASATAFVPAPPPMTHRLVSASLEGVLEGSFVRFEAEIRLESFSDDWQTVEVLRGPIAIESAILGDQPVALLPDWTPGEARRLEFGRAPRSAAGRVFPGSALGAEILGQDLWREARFRLPFRGRGSHICRLIFQVPVEKHEERYGLDFGLAPVPLTFVKIRVTDQVLAVEETSFRDWSVEAQDRADPAGARGCSFVGWLGAEPSLRLTWRRKARRLDEEPPAPVSEPVAAPASGSDQVASGPAPVVAPKPVKAPPKPLVYARTETLITLGEAALQGRIDIEYSVTKAPVASFTILLPATVEVLGVTSDRPQSHQVIRDGEHKRLVVDFLAAREDAFPLSVTFEAKMDETLGTYRIPDVHPIGVEREQGSLALQALTSVEVQPTAAMEKTPPPNLFRIDAVELPATLKQRAFRPILLAYRLSARPAAPEIQVKRYQDLPLQTVVADQMDVKTSFTTNGNSQTQVTLRLRNNNKQYLSLQLASGTEVLSALRDNQPIKLVAGRGDGRVQVPLRMSRNLGRPEDMELKILVKNAVATMSWMGHHPFEAPLVDVPVSHFTWTFFAPVNHVLYKFTGTINPPDALRDPFLFRGFLTLYDLATAVLLDPHAFTLALFVLIVALLIVSREWLWWLLTGAWNTVVAMVTFVFTGKGFRLAELMIVVMVLGILGAMAVPNFRKAREQARGKACYANQRVLQGAVEMFNMDHSPGMTTLDIPALRRGQYLKSDITSPMPECGYESCGDLTESGFVYCRNCGGVDHTLDEIRVLAGMPRSSQEESARETGRADKAAGAAPGGPSATGFTAGGRTRGTLPLEAKFVLTPNFWTVSRDLVLADIASDGSLLANSTCPQVTVRFMRREILQGLKIASFILGLLAGFYFIGGTYHQYLPKLFVGAVIILILSAWDQLLPAIGDAANLGLWLALAGGVLWKIGWAISLQNLSLGGSGDEGGPAPRGPGGSDGPGGPGGSGGPPRRVIRGRGPGVSGINFDDPVTTQPLPDTPAGGAPPAGEPARSESRSPGLTVAVVLGFVLAGALAAAGEPVPAPTPVPVTAPRQEEIRVLVPFTDLSKVVGPEDKMVLISEEEYRALAETGERPPAPPAPPPVPWSVREASYVGTVGDRGVRFRARFDLDLWREGWKQVPLLTSAVVPSQARLDGNPTPLDLVPGGGGESFYGLVIDGTGSRRLEVEFFLPLAATEFNTRRIELPTIPFCRSTLEVTVPEAECDAWVDPGVLWQTASGREGSTFRALLPPTPRVRLELVRRLPAPKETVQEETPAPSPESASAAAPAAPVVLREETRVVVTERNLLVCEEGFVRGHNRYALQISGSEGITSFTLRVPPQVRILEVKDRPVEDWKVEERPDENWRRLNIAFASEVKGQIAFTVDFEEDIQQRKEELYQVPELVPVMVDRSQGLLAVGCLPALELAVPEAPQGYSPIDVGEFLREYQGQPPDKLPFAFKFLRHPNRLRLAVTRPKDIEQSTAVVDKAEAVTLVNEEGYLLTRMAFEVRNNSEQFLKIQLPRLGTESATLWSSEVADQAVKAGYDPEQQVFNVPIIRSPMVDGQSQPFPVEVIYAQRLPTRLSSFLPVRFELPRVHLDVSEMNWVVYLPEGYELMRGQGNVDRLMDRPAQPLLEGQKRFPGLDLGSLLTTRSQATLGGEGAGNAIVGLLPVEFRIPTTGWPTSFSMQQIDPRGVPPHVAGVLVSPKAGPGRVFQLVMLLAGCLAGAALVFLGTGPRRFFWFAVLAVLSCGLAFTLMMKLYQADHFFKMGFLVVFVTMVLSAVYRWKPAGAPPAAAPDEAAPAAPAE